MESRADADRTRLPVSVPTANFTAAIIRLTVTLMRAVAIPNDQSRRLDLSAADWQLPSLAAVVELLSSIP